MKAPEVLVMSATDFACLVKFPHWLEEGPATHFLVGVPFLSWLFLGFPLFLEGFPTTFWFEAFWKWLAKALANHPTTLRQAML